MANANAVASSSNDSNMRWRWRSGRAGRTGGGGDGANNGGDRRQITARAACGRREWVVRWCWWRVVVTGDGNAAAACGDSQPACVCGELCLWKWQWQMAAANGRSGEMMTINNGANAVQPNDKWTAVPRMRQMQMPARQPCWWTCNAMCRRIYLFIYLNAINKGIIGTPAGSPSQTNP